MKAILKFQLPEEQDEWEQHLNVYKMAGLIEEMHTYLRTYNKHHEPKERPKCEEIYQEWCRMREEHDV